MKQLYLIAGLVLVLVAGLRAQTNAVVSVGAKAATNVVANAPQSARPPTRIDSDSADFDLTARRATYRGNVRVDDPQMKLTCELLIADLPQTGGHIDHLVALTNVVMDSVDEKGQTNHATSDKAIYDYNIKAGVTNETVTLTGNAKVENSQGKLTGEPIFWDRILNRITATNMKMEFRQNLITTPTNTNAPAGKTNLPPAMKSLPMSKTNYPPGTIQNIDRISNSSTTQ